MIAVTTPNGRIGSIVVEKLIARGEQIRVVSYNPAQLPVSVREQCEVVHGSLDDVATLKRGFDGAEAIFWCIPQTRRGNMWDDAHEYHQRFAIAASAALTGSNVRVVAASASRHGYDDNAIVSAFAAVEDRMNASGVAIRHLRSAFFMENLMETLPTIVASGAVFYNGPGDVPLPMVCVADVADKAVELIVDRAWHGQDHVALHGPAHVSFDEMATILSDVVAAPIRYVRIPDEVLIENLQRAGTSEGFATAYARLLTEEALQAYDIEPRTPETTTPTTLREWASKVLLPAYLTLKTAQASKPS